MMLLRRLPSINIVHTNNYRFYATHSTTPTTPTTTITNESSNDNTSNDNNDNTTLLSTTTNWISLDNYPGMSAAPFPQEVIQVLLAPLNPKDVEVRPEGILYLPEIKYRRILNRAFGPGAWALVPRGESVIKGKILSRDYALFCLGRFVAQAKGDHESFTGASLSVGTAEESAKSNALMRCCKDLGIASELWDPSFIVEWKDKYATAVFCENQLTKKKVKLWRRKDRPAFQYPYVESSGASSFPSKQ